ncbi:MAG TPA: pitrilysin family protein [Alphaproteobacteria bacterium]|nr:pitrilysin family protein [Alphaproteobacteria bacterium]
MAEVESVSLGVWVEAGARYEQAAESGISHLLEHMAFKGTARRSARDIAEEIEAVGGQMNAYTARENTAYYVKVLKDDVPLALDILGDILRNSAMDADELARERDVVLQEIGQARDTPDDIVFDHFQETAFPGQPLGRPVLGDEAVVGSVERASLVGYMARHYGAQRMVLAAAGKIEHERLVELAGAALGDVARGSPAQPEAGRYAGGEFRAERKLEQAHIVLGFEGVAIHDPDFYALQLLSMALGGGMSSRLFQEVRERRGLVYTIHAFASSFTDSGVFGIYAGTGEEEVAEVVPVICEELAHAGSEASKAEVDRAVAQLKAGLLMGLESPGARSEQLAQQLLIFGRPIPTSETIRKIEAVDKIAVARVAARLMASRPTLAALGPIGRLEPYEAVAARLA